MVDWHNVVKARQFGKLWDWRKRMKYSNYLDVRDFHRHNLVNRPIGHVRLRTTARKRQHSSVNYIYWWIHLFLSSKFNRRKKYQTRKSRLKKQRYLCDTFIPSTDDLTTANDEFEWFPTGSWWIEYGSIIQCTGVMNNDGLASFWETASYLFSHKWNQISKMYR